MLTQGLDLAHAPRWPRGPGGIAVIHYRINPRGAVTSLDDAHVISAVRAGFATWQNAVPKLRFVYDGTTLSPAISGDGQNVVGFGDLTSGSHLGQAATRLGSHGEIAEADMLLTAGHASISSDGFGPEGWTWLPCGTNGTPCTDIHTCSQVVVERCDHDLQNAVTHEVGHWLWLGDLRTAQDSLMTMYGSIGATASERFFTERHKVTLALGDVMGARALYPCECAMSKIADP